MKTLRMLTLALAVAVVGVAGTLNQHWSGPFYEAYIDNVSVEGSTVPGAPASENYIVVSFVTFDCKTHGFSFVLYVEMKDGTVMHWSCNNLPLSTTDGDPAVFKVSTGDAAPARVLIFSVQKLITDYATLFISLPVPPTK